MSAADEGYQQRFGTWRTWLLISALIGGVGVAPTALGRCLEPESDRPTIGLVLGGGGARGSAHIGVIRVLEEMKIPVDCVAGTSIGSLVGALFATGMNADELEHVMLSIDWDDLFNDDTERKNQPYRRKRDDNLALSGVRVGIGKDVSLIGTGAISGQKISFLFESLVKERVQTDDFDALPIPFRAVASDIVTGQEVVLGDGDLALAMRSSMSVPGVFDPVQWGQHMLVDGGIANNVPMDVVRGMGADILIVVEVGSGLAFKEQLNNALAIVGQLSNILIDRNTQQQLATLTDVDVLIRPALGDKVSSAGFAKTAEGIAIGFEAADQARAELAHLALSAETYAAHQLSVASRITPSPIIQFVELDNQTRFKDSVLIERMDVELGAPLNIEALNENVRDIYGLGYLEVVRYEVVERDGQAGIVIHAHQDTRGTRMLEWGIDYFGNATNSSVNVRVGYLDTAVDEYGSEMRVLAQLGESPGLFGYLYKYINPALKLFVAPRVFVEERDFLSYEPDLSGDARLSAEVLQYGAGFDIGREFGNWAAASLGVQTYHGEIDVSIGPPQDGDFDGGEYVATFAFDRMDDRYFPGDGAFAGVRYVKSDEDLGADEEFEQMQLSAFVARSFGRHSLLAGARYDETLEGEAPIYALFRNGGLARMSGYQDGELVGQNFAMVLGGYRYHFAGSGLMPAFLGTTFEYGRAAEDPDDLFDDGLFNGSVYLGYRSPLGPLYLGVGMAEEGRVRYFLRIGNVFGTSSIGRQ